MANDEPAARGTNGAERMDGVGTIEVTAAPTWSGPSLESHMPEGSPGQ